MEMTRSWERFENDEPLERRRKDDLPMFQVHRAAPKEKRSKNQRNPKEKERAKNWGVTHSGPNLDKSLLVLTSISPALHSTLIPQPNRKWILSIP
jgi:hypothetical protein